MQNGNWIDLNWWELTGDKVDFSLLYLGRLDCLVKLDWEM